MSENSENTEASANVSTEATGSTNPPTTVADGESGSWAEMVEYRLSELEAKFKGKPPPATQTEIPQVESATVETIPASQAPKESEAKAEVKVPAQPTKHSRARRFTLGKKE